MAIGGIKPSMIDIKGAAANQTLTFNAATNLVSFESINPVATITSDTITFNSGNVLPAANVAYSLGSSQTAWKNIYLGSGHIYLGNVSIGLDASSNVVITNLLTSQTGKLAVDEIVLGKGTNTQVIKVDPDNSSNVLIGTFPIAAAPYVAPFQLGGTEYGYITGGQDSRGIQKFTFTSDSPATSVGEFHGGSVIRSHGGTSSSTHGYLAGGTTESLSNQLSKFPFSSGISTSSVGVISSRRDSGASANSSDNGYYAGSNPSRYQTIDKWSFSSDVNGANIGSITTSVNEIYGGNSSSTHGYRAGGDTTIDKWPFSSDESATDVGELNNTVRRGSGQSSSTHGYVSGNWSLGGPATDAIEKFPFSSDTNSTDVAELAVAVYEATGVSSTTFGYVCGGQTNNIITSNINKFPFSSDTTVSDIAETHPSSVISKSAGHQI